MTTIVPKFREIAFAGLIAALVTPLIFSLAFAAFTILDRPADPASVMSSMLFVGTVAGRVSVMLTLLVAIPLAMLLRTVLQPRWSVCALAGVLIAVVSMLLWTLPIGPDSFWFSGGEWLIVDGQRTAAGWRSLWLQGAVWATFGLIGGSLFWFALRHLMHRRMLWLGLIRPANQIAPLGEQSLIKAAEVFAAEDLRAVVDLHEARPGNYASVDQAAIDAIFARYPQATPEHREALLHYAMLLTR